MITLEYLGDDFNKLDLAMYRYNSELGIALPSIVRQTARLLNKDLVDLTPPKNQAQGRAAVARDVNRAITMLDPAKIHWPVLRQAILDGEFEVVQSFLRILRAKGNFLGRFELVPFDTILHTGVRDRRGRVQRMKWKATIEVSKHKKYVRDVQNNVGYTRAYWKASALTLGNQLPSWITRHATKGALGVVNNLSDEKHPSITMSNIGPGIEALSRHVIASAIRRRTIAMEKDVDRIVAGGASRYF